MSKRITVKIIFVVPDGLYDESEHDLMDHVKDAVQTVVSKKLIDFYASPRSVGMTTVEIEEDK